MSSRDIHTHVGKVYGVETAPDLASAVTDAVIDQVRVWQNRPLETIYAIVDFDSLRVKIERRGHGC